MIPERCCGTACQPVVDDQRTRSEASISYCPRRGCWSEQYRSCSIGADSDVLQFLDSPIDLVLVGNAFHHMDQPRLLASLDGLVSPTGVLVVCSTSVPVWLQDTDWSATVRDQLSVESGRHRVSADCGHMTIGSSRRRGL